MRGRGQKRYFVPGDGGAGVRADLLGAGLRLGTERRALNRGEALFQERQKGARRRHPVRGAMDGHASLGALVHGGSRRREENFSEAVDRR